MPGKSVSPVDAPLQGNVVGQYLLRKRPGALRGGQLAQTSDAQTASELQETSIAPATEPGSGGDREDSIGTSTTPSQHVTREPQEIDAGATPSCQAFVDLEHAHAFTAIDHQVEDSIDSVTAGRTADLRRHSCTAATPPGQRQAWVQQDHKHQQALLAAQNALEQAEEARSSLHAQLEDLQSQAAQGADKADRLQALQEELEERDVQMAEQEARVADMAQALRDGQLQAESAKAALMRALREGQSEAAASTRPTAREMSRVADESNLLEIVYKFSGMYVDLQDLYVRETAERRRLHNTLVDMKGAIRVFARLRPPFAQEAGAQPAVACDTMGAVIDATTRLTGRAGGTKHARFEFDAVFGPASTQEDVYAEAAPVVTSVLDGYHVCMFAYGQTGSGKTHTMQGAPQDRGVNFRALEDLFRLVAIRAPEADYEMHVSLVEVYLEKIRDLLNASPSAANLDVKHNAHGSYLPDLIEKKVQTASEAQHWLCTGLANRASGETAMNQQSSRSHCLLCVRITGRSKLTGDIWRAKLWLVDLAGSERLDKARLGAGPEAHRRLQEAQFINKSLASLGDCIHALASRAPHVPFRNSKLTYLLQDSLAGGSKTLMFANVSPSQSDAGESMCSLNFAVRVRGVELGAVRRNIDAAADVRALQEQVAAQQKQICRLQAEQEHAQRELRAARTAATSPGFAKMSAGGSPSGVLACASPSKPWGAGAGAAGSLAKSVARFRAPVPRMPHGAASGRGTPRSAVRKVSGTPRSAVHRLVGSTMRRASTLAAGMVAKSAMSPSAKALHTASSSRPPASAFKPRAKAVFGLPAPTSAAPSSRPAAAQAPTTPAPAGPAVHSKQADKIPALHPSSSLAADAAKPASASEPNAAQGPGSRPPIVPRLKLPIRPVLSADISSHGDQPEIAGQAPALPTKPGIAESRSQADESLAKFISYYHSTQQNGGGSSQHPGPGSGMAGAARIRAPASKTPMMLTKPERTPMPARRKPA